MSILVLNLGLKSVRCIAFSFDGRVLSQSSQPIHTFVSNQRVEQDPIEWRKSSWQVIQDVSNNLGQKKEYVRFITVTTSASCLVPLDNQGNPISNAILVSDTRSVDEARLLAHTVEFQTVQNESGMKSSPDLMLPKIMWLARHEPGIFKRTAFFVNAGDYLIMQLTGRCVTDPNNAAKFHYLTSRHSYPEALIESLGVGYETLLDVLEIGTNLGPILSSVGSELGLPSSCEVVLSTYDSEVQTKVRTLPKIRIGTIRSTV